MNTGLLLSRFLPHRPVLVMFLPFNAKQKTSTNIFHKTTTPDSISTSFS